MTYSIVARDAATGALGVAVQSHWFTVGGTVPAAEAGTGAIATQANPGLHFKAQGLDLLRQGLGAEEALARLLAEDDAAEHRQVAIVDARGGAAAHTGSSCMRDAGHLVGDGFTVQANIMRSSAVWSAMHDAFEASRQLGLVDGLLAALDAGESAGGDLRGRQSAAVLVVPGGDDPAGRGVDLRVEDSADPLGELRRLVRLDAAYRHADAGDQRFARGDHRGADREYTAAFDAAPEKRELRFWAGLGAVAAGDPHRGLPLLRDTVEQDGAWLELLRRLDPDVPAAAEALRLLQR